MAENYQIKKGDCLHCLATERGLFGASVWSHSQNQAIRSKRGSVDKLIPGDIVFIPDIRPKEVSEPTDQVHKFYLKNEIHQHWVEIELIDEEDKPVPGVKYKITLPGGAIQEGTLDQNGWTRVQAYAEGSCKVSFPELDETSWELIETAGPKISR
jgi:hypothetical protein